MNFQQIQQTKRLLIYRYGNLILAAKALGISYYRLVNILSGRTVPNEEESEQFQGLPSHNSEGV